jgi:hypothetical protein
VGAAARPAVGACALALLVGGCLEARAPFEAVDRIAGADGLTRLTYSPGDERSPSWLAAGTVMYVAEALQRPGERGSIVAMPADGSGPALPVLRGVPTETWYLTPKRGPDGRIVYVQVWSFVEDLCFGVATVVECTPNPLLPVPPLLLELRYRVRRAEDEHGYLHDPAVGLLLPGYTAVPSTPYEERLDMHPALTLYATEGVHGFRPDWSPDGGRIVLSDGERLLLWTPGADAADPIPGTDGGISPAWSPDGGWIAYTRLVPGDTISTSCDAWLNRAFPPYCRIDQTAVLVAQRWLVLVRPDGSEKVVVGPGEEPAWAPDGTLYYRREDRLWRHGAEPQPLPGTTGGREPAVSPDGRRLVFSYRNENGKHDLWVLRLDP